ncbi:hypothetical protein [Myxacorys almedinensis]|uniref:Nucleotide-diphospho-sugar transferase domain-containing protein n=1 Tax=Myxacorys almedinensis A TaxID=2690445 RepID=A0A8J8CKL6_9CYAN|nr:hypothetical protein [Myxacorys almedinensis]NDJ18741.1 hypothetical protein [Myxacorys almedinensis A]
MAIPIITIHYGYAPYLLHVLAQAKATNPRSTVILIGDSRNAMISFVSHQKASDYFEEARQFEQLYRDKHASPNSYEYELICFQRWFILKEFMEKNQIERAMHIDSDLMLYTDITEEVKKFGDCEFTIQKQGCGHNSFVTLSGIRKFCNLIRDTYSDLALFAIIQEQQKEREEKRVGLSIMQIGGISDMSLLRRFYQINSDNIHSTAEIVEGAVFDLKMDSSSGGFEMENGLKKIQWFDRQPFCKNLELNQLIRFNSLHFQGSTKQFISRYFTGNQFQILYHKIKIRLLWKLNLIQL